MSFSWLVNIPVLTNIRIFYDCLWCTTNTVMSTIYRSYSFNYGIIHSIWFIFNGDVMLMKLAFQMFLEILLKNTYHSTDDDNVINNLTRLFWFGFIIYFTIPEIFIFSFISSVILERTTSILKWLISLCRIIFVLRSWKAKKRAET